MTHRVPAEAGRLHWSRLPWPVSAWMTGAVGFSCLPILISRDVREPGGSFMPSALGLLTVTGLLAVQIRIDRRYPDRPPKAVAMTALVAQAALVEVLTQTDGLSVASIMYLALPYPAVFWLGARAGIAVSLLILAWFTLRFSARKPLWAASPDDLHAYALFALAIVLVTATALLVRREQGIRRRAEDLLDELVVSHRQLVDSQTRVAELATIEERNRLARDIHDSLGHYLTVVSVQLEKAQVLLPPGEETAAVAIGNAKRLADQALTDVRQSVETLHRGNQGDRTPFALGPTLRALVDDLQVLPLTVELRITGEEHRYSAQPLVALYRAAQEGLTNVQRHARATRVRLTVELDEQSARLTVDDDGLGPPIVPGHGLRGVRERVELVSGRLALSGSPDGGTRLSVTLPRLTTGRE